MRIIAKSTLRIYDEEYADARDNLEVWQGLIASKDFSSLHDLRETFNSVDMVGKYHIFNIKGNDYRLIVAIHYNTHMVYIDLTPITVPLLGLVKSIT